MKKRYIILFVIIGIFCFQFFVVERSEYVAGQNRYYTYYDKYFDNEIDIYSSSAFDNDTYNLEQITDKINSSYDEIEKIRVNLRKLYEKLSSNSATLDYYKSSINELRTYENEIEDISFTLKICKSHLKELKYYISENENEVMSIHLYNNEIGFYLEKTNKIDSFLHNYLNFSNQLASIVQKTIEKTEQELARIERKRKLAREQQYRSSISEFKSNFNKPRNSNYNYTNTSLPTNSYDARSSSGIEYYINTDGYRVQSPTYYSSPPKGATALCNDGTYSFSRNRRGTCSGHGGVRKWL